VPASRPAGAGYTPVCVRPPQPGVTSSPAVPPRAPALLPPGCLWCSPGSTGLLVGCSGCCASAVENSRFERERDVGRTHGAALAANSTWPACHTQIWPSDLAAGPNRNVAASAGEPAVEQPSRHNPPASSPQPPLPPQRRQGASPAQVPYAPASHPSSPRRSSPRSPCCKGIWASWQHVRAAPPGAPRAGHLAQIGAAGATPLRMAKYVQKHVGFIA
jgi:hypothetical protein